MMLFSIHRFLQELLKNVSKGLYARLQLGKKSAKEQHALQNTHLQKLQNLKLECKTVIVSLFLTCDLLMKLSHINIDFKFCFQFYLYNFFARKTVCFLKHCERYLKLSIEFQIRQTVPKKIDKAIEVIVNECFVYMSSKSGKEHILNPQCRTPMMDVPWTLGLFVEEIKSRINIYIETFLQSPDVLQKFEDIKNEIIDFYNRVSVDLSSLEADWTYVRKHEFSCDKSMGDPFKKFYEFPLPLQISMLAVSVVITAAAAVCLLLFSPVFGPSLMLMNTDDAKMEIIDRVYDANMDSIQSQIQKHLKERCGNALNLLVEKVSKRWLPNQINSLETMIQQLSHSREEILANIESISYLASKLEAMRMSAEDLQSILMDEI